MDSFQAQLTVGADPTPIEATVTLDGSNLEIASYGESLGKWQIANLGLERVLGGYKMRVEGETAVLKFSEPERFADALDGSVAVASKPEPKPKKPKREKPKREKAPKEEKAREGRHDQAAVTTPVPAIDPAVPPAEIPAETSARAVKPEKAPRATSTVGWLDQKLEVAQRRFGKNLPEWIFSRGGVVVALGVLILLVAKPGWFSTLFLIVAAIGLITSAIALLDQVVAVRIFRGGFTPIQGLITSLVVGLVGILLGAL